MHARPEDITVADLATARPAAMRVLYRRRIEFCAGDSRHLAEACGEAGVEVAALMAEVDREEATAEEQEAPWSTRPLTELVDHIRWKFHDVEHREMARLQLLLDLEVGKGARSQRDALSAAFACFHDEIAAHMAKEEAVLFPWLQSGRGELARAPIQVMVMEHNATLRLLNHLRDLTAAFRSASSSPAAIEICIGLADLDWQVRQHMHLENNILFPRALRGEQ